MTNSQRRIKILYPSILLAFLVVLYLLGGRHRVQKAVEPTVAPSAPVEYRSFENLSYAYYALSGDPLETTINGHTVTFQLLEAARTSANNPRLFSTTFAILNNGPEPITLNPNEVFAAANSSGVPRSRGSKVVLVDAKPIELKSRVETEFTFNWDMNMDYGNVWIVVNTPITEQNTVALQPDLKVFLLTFDDTRK